MNGNTKATLAIVLGAVGLLLGGLGTITAYNAKSSVDSDAETAKEVTALVDERFGEAQTRQDQMEANQKSDAEKFVDQLTKDERSLLQKINRNHRQINRVKRQNRQLRRQVNNLKGSESQLNNRINDVANDLNQSTDSLNNRINQTNKNVRQLQRQMANLRGLVR